MARAVSAMIGTVANSGMAAQAFDRLDPIDAGHLDIHEDQVWFLSANLFDGLKPSLTSITSYPFPFR